MAMVFFKEFGLNPDFHIDLFETRPTSQIGEMVLKLSNIIAGQKPDLIIVVGDVNSTLAGAIAANKMKIQLAHLESGLRSGDRTMPEEINRILVDQITDHYFITEQSGIDNLTREGLKHNHYFVGNTMIDALIAFDEQIQNDKVLQKFKIHSDFVLMTIHRPATVDSEGGLLNLIELIQEISQKLKVIFPIHPRTIDRLKAFGLLNNLSKISNLLLTEPLGYFSFQKLISSCKLIITDSGGIQEESTYRQIPCLTLRHNTERPVTVTKGTNQLITPDPEIVGRKVQEVLDGKGKKGSIPELWDGKATERVFEIIDRILLD
jgi:UDP-N-acetylglucosamine 2-epimerase (non-hydrolysing)